MELDKIYDGTDIRLDRRRYKRLEYLVTLFHNVSAAADALAAANHGKEVSEICECFDQIRAEILTSMQADLNKYGPFSMTFLKNLWAEEVDGMVGD